MRSQWHSLPPLLLLLPAFDRNQDDAIWEIPGRQRVSPDFARFFWDQRCTHHKVRHQPQKVHTPRSRFHRPSQPRHPEFRRFPSIRHKSVFISRSPGHGTFRFLLPGYHNDNSRELLLLERFWSSLRLFHPRNLYGVHSWQSHPVSLLWTKQ